MFPFGTVSISASIETVEGKMLEIIFCVVIVVELTKVIHSY